MGILWRWFCTMAGTNLKQLLSDDMYIPYQTQACLMQLSDDIRYPDQTEACLNLPSLGELRWYTNESMLSH